MASYMCKYDDINDKKIWKPTMRSVKECHDKMGQIHPGLSDGAKSWQAGTTNLRALEEKTACNKDNYVGERYFVKRKKARCKDSKKDVYKLNNTLCESTDQGMNAYTRCSLGGIVDTKELEALLGESEVDCVEKTIHSCYERGLFVNPLTRRFKINIDKNDKEALNLIDEMNNEANKTDTIPVDEYDELNEDIYCDDESFENMDEFSNYINSIKELNKPNYLNNIYYLLIFIFLFYIFMKLYTKKK